MAQEVVSEGLLRAKQEALTTEDIELLELIPIWGKMSEQQKKDYEYAVYGGV